jgi:para-aminobenzoate synthetase component I
MHTKKSYNLYDVELIKAKVLDWVKQFGTFCLLDNHCYQLEHHSLECLVAAGAKREFSAPETQVLENLQQFIDAGNGWLFGHLGYDLKNEIESSFSSEKENAIGFPSCYFFEPEVLIHISGVSISIEADDPDAIWTAINNVVVYSDTKQASSLQVGPRLTRDEYISTIRELKQHILRGDCYEINFCQEFFTTDAVVDPIAVYKKLSLLSPNPFSALYKVNDQWLICASPERFLRKEGNTVLSQPIKGTSKRVKDDAVQDNASREELFSSKKDRSENVMVVDLVRNDLSKVCEEGSVKVDELFGIYSFPQVHQMISTISGRVKEAISFTEIIRATFPMGSMTGAPKKKVMELIEQYEKTKRGIFSGAVGYISPNGDFDFNVIIRSIMYNEAARYISVQAGSGITFYSDPEKEWEECMMKVAAMKTALNEDESE